MIGLQTRGEMVVEPQVPADCERTCPSFLRKPRFHWAFPKIWVVSASQKTLRGCGSVC